MAQTRGGETGWPIIIYKSNRRKLLVLVTHALSGVDGTPQYDITYIGALAWWGRSVAALFETQR